MEIKIHIEDYNETGLDYQWRDGFIIEVTENKSEIVIAANKEGLISLAAQLLTLAQDNVPDGPHYHYDHFSCLEDGSKSLVIVKHSFF
jgi:hypothetical protein